ncbi:MAG TPA: CerR family C-terminal domain-containing protein [Pseudomonadales bacterium]|nr:CerR family C-terminal domain-containing protein [Pseudomonadales bacterium]
MSDHSDAADRLLQAALEVFAAKGYEGASTREICRLAGVNVAAIHYHFGDKATLYREVFRVPEQLGVAPYEMTDPNASIRTGLVAFYRHIMAYIAAPKQVQQLRLIFLREELQPSGVLSRDADAPRRLHDHLTAFLCRSVGADAVDTAVNHLAFSVGGLSLVLFVQRTAIDEIAPEMLADDAAVEATIQRLADHGTAMVDAERARRANAAFGTTSASPAHDTVGERATATANTTNSDLRSARIRAAEQS